LSTSKKDVLQVMTSYKKKNISLSLSYEKNDSRVILYSPYLHNINMSADLIRFAGDYTFADVFSVSANYNYIKVAADNNNGNDLRIRLGKSIIENINLGYEFNYISYSRISPLYYSPRNFQSHSVWGDWNFYSDRLSSFNVGGKVGYVPNDDFILREIYGEAMYHPVQILTIAAKVSNSSTIRSGIGYNFWAGYLTCYLSIF
jgi:hypothetical protein